MKIFIKYKQKKRNENKVKQSKIDDSDEDNTELKFYLKVIKYNKIP